MGHCHPASSDPCLAVYRQRLYSCLRLVRWQFVLLGWISTDCRDDHRPPTSSNLWQDHQEWCSMGRCFRSMALWSSCVPQYVALSSLPYDNANIAVGLGSGGAAQAFAWLLNLSTVAGLIAWATLCFCYIRFHKALKVQNVSRDTLPWKGPLQPFTAWYGFIGSIIITLVSGFPVFLKGNWNTSSFVASYVGIPIFIVPIIGWKLWHGTKVNTKLSKPLRGTMLTFFHSSIKLTKLIYGLDDCRRQTKSRKRGRLRFGDVS